MALWSSCGKRYLLAVFALGLTALVAPAAAVNAREGVFLRRVLEEVHRPQIQWEVPPPCLKGHLPFRPLAPAADDAPVSCNGNEGCRERLASMSPAQVRARVIQQLDEAEEKDRQDALKCLAQQMDGHIAQLNAVNDAAIQLRSKYLALQRERTHTQDLLFKARNELFELEARERAEMAQLQRKEAEALLRERKSAVVQEAKEKKETTEQTEKTKALEKQREESQRAMDALKEKEAKEETEKLTEQTEKANRRLAEERVRDALRKKLESSLGGGHAAAEHSNSPARIDDPVTAKLVPAHGPQNPGETHPLLVDELDELPEDQVGSDIPEDESVEAETPGYKGKSRHPLGGNIIVHIGADGVTVGRQENSEESSEESSKAEESSEESSKLKAEESAAPKPLLAEEHAEHAEESTASQAAKGAAKAASEMTEHAAEHAAEHTAEHAEHAEHAAKSEESSEHPEHAQEAIF